MAHENSNKATVQRWFNLEYGDQFTVGSAPVDSDEAFERFMSDIRNPSLHKKDTIFTDVWRRQRGDAAPLGEILLEQSTAKRALRQLFHDSLTDLQARNDGRDWIMFCDPSSPSKRVLVPRAKATLEQLHLHVDQLAAKQDKAHDRLEQKLVDYAQVNPQHAEEVYAMLIQLRQRA